MNHSGDAAEQIVRMTLEGAEVAARITGTAAKEIALLLLAALKSPDKAANGLKLKGKARLESMLKSGKPLEIFSVRERDLKTFVREAKRYGIVYCVLRNSKNAPDRVCDIMVKANDAPKINRIVERFKLAAVDTARIEQDVERDMANRTAAAPAESDPAAVTSNAPEFDGTTPPPFQFAATSDDPPEINDVDALVNQLLGTDKDAPEINDVDALVNQLLGADKDKDALTAPEPEKQTRKRGRKSRKGAAKETEPAADERNAPDPLASGGADNPAADNPETTSPETSGQPPKTGLLKRFFGSNEKSATRGSSRKPSVKGELRGIAAEVKGKEAESLKRDPPVAAKAKTTPPPQHKQPKGKRKSKKSKGR